MACFGEFMPHRIAAVSYTHLDVYKRQDFKHPSAKYHEKSHGESFLALAQNNLRPNGLYLFDERCV